MIPGRDGWRMVSQSRKALVLLVIKSMSSTIDNERQIVKALVGFKIGD